MTIKVEMTAEEFTEFLQFRNEKAVKNEELTSALRSVRAYMEKLANTLLTAVDYDWLKKEKPCVKNEEIFKEAVQLAAEWFC